MHSNKFIAYTILGTNIFIKMLMTVSHTSLLKLGQLSVEYIRSAILFCIKKWFGFLIYILLFFIYRSSQEHYIPYRFHPPSDCSIQMYESKVGSINTSQENKVFSPDNMKTRILASIHVSFFLLCNHITITRNLCLSDSTYHHVKVLYRSIS